MDKANLISDLASEIAQSPHEWELLKEAIEAYLTDWPSDQEKDLFQMARDWGIEPICYDNEKDEVKANA
jgi:hypothetical protein